MSNAFNKIAAGPTDVLAVARGEKAPARLHVPLEIDVRTIRAKACLSQDRFASAYGFSIHHIR